MRVARLVVMVVALAVLCLIAGEKPKQPWLPEGIYRVIECIEEDDELLRLTLVPVKSDVQPTRESMADKAVELLLLNPGALSSCPETGSPFKHELRRSEIITMERVACEEGEQYVFSGHETDGSPLLFYIRIVGWKHDDYDRDKDASPQEIAALVH